MKKNNEKIENLILKVLGILGLIFYFLAAGGAFD
jgi:hypothetical protein